MMDFLTSFLLFLVFLGVDINTVNGVSYSTFVKDSYIGVSCDEYVTWNEALEYCETQIGSTLASIHSDNDNENALLAVAGTSNAPDDTIIRYAWIGYNDLNNDGEFEWTDGSAAYYENWDTNTGQPNSNNQDCGQLSGMNNVQWEGRWNDDECDRRETSAFVCNKPRMYIYMPCNINCVFFYDLIT